ncbi:MAG: hypothetical protein SH848_12810 [Saprospiraceae bacterium]|nr:hypothetical protein [Saprospiraceae bacterium]MDZ4704808.1 hypothetical protein [Saprospiraceae bacterium]
MAGIQEDLFELIQTLSVAEKRYFKVVSNSSKSSDIKYVILFDALCGLDYYDEQMLIGKLQRKLKNNSDKNPGKQLNQDMQYLYKVLLQAMRQYNHQTLINIQIQDMTFDGIFLRDRGLYRQADKRISRAKELAEKNHNYIALLELNRLERTLIWSLNEANEEEKVEQLIAEKNEISKVLSEEMDYEDLYARVSHAINRQNLFTSNDPHAVELVGQIETLFSQKQPDELSAFTKLRRFQIGALLNMAEMRLDECRANIDNIFNWWETYEYLKEEEFFRYQISLSKILTFFLNNRQFDAIILLIKKIKESNSKTPNEKAFLFRFITMYELLYYLNMKRVDEAQKMIPDIAKGLDQFPLPHKRKITICYNLAIVCFFNNDNRQCDDWLKKTIAHSRNNNIREDLIRKAFVLRVLLLEDFFEDQEKALRAAKKYFRESKKNKGKEKKGANNQPIEVEILMLITKIINAPAGNRERDEPVQKMLEYLESMSSNPQSRRLYGLEELIIWCKSKLEWKSVKTIFLEDSGLSSG